MYFGLGFVRTLPIIKNLGLICVGHPIKIKALRKKFLETLSKLRIYKICGFWTEYISSRIKGCLKVAV